MHVDALLGRLKGVAKEGDGWKTLCPAHDDRKPSLSISTGNDGRILLTCRAGCPTGNVVAAMGLKLSDLFADGAKSSGRTAKARIVTTYDYNDESGVLLFQVCRFDPKDFRQRRPDGKGGWTWSTKGVRKVLFRLPETIAAVAAGKRVVGAEGEKDVLALVDHGFDATCNPGGAGNWLDDHTHALRGAQFVIIADKDTPGRAAATKVAGKLRGVAASVKVIECPDVGGRAVKDAADYFAAGGTAEALGALMDAAPEFVAQPETSEDSPEAESDEEALSRLAELSPMEFDRQLKEVAKALGVSPTTLRKEVEKRREKGADGLQGSELKLPEIELWPEAVDGTAALDAAAQTFRQYVALPDGAADAMALWAAHTHSLDAFQCSPRLNICSPEKGCGKTTLRDVVALLVPKPLTTENLSSAVLFRLVEAHRPTLLADEYDAWLHDNEELRGLLNAGHRRGGQAFRCEGEDHVVRAFNVFAPVVLAGIGSLPGTLHDRSIIIRLERAKPGELRRRFDSRHTAREGETCRKLARWCADNADRLAACDPVMPGEAFNRLADNWRPLFAIAEVAGGDWPARAGAAFSKLTQRDDADAQGMGVMLLTDIRRIFAEGRAERMLSALLTDALCEMTDRPWPEAHRGKPISQTWLARRLRGFGITTRTLRIGQERGKGYEVADFTDAFERYLPPSGQTTRDSVTTPDFSGVEPGLGSVTHAANVTATEPQQPLGIADLARCHASIDRDVAAEAEVADLI